MFGLGGVLLAACGIGPATAASGAVGDHVSASLFCRDPAPDWKDAPKLVVLMPAHSTYGGMLRLAFQQYFRFAQALPPIAREPGVRTVFVTGAVEEPATLFTDSDCAPVIDAQALAGIASATGRTLPLADDADATVLLLDAHDVVRWRDDGYRAQGEHLKPLEAAVKGLLGAPDPIAADPGTPPPVVGDQAPDFAIGMPAPRGQAARPSATGPRLSDLRGKVVVLAFYPAAYSGTLPLQPGSVEAKIEAARARERRRMMSCAVQLDEMDRLLAKDDPLRGDVVRLAVSASTPVLLDGWRRVLETRDLRYVNDPDYAIARRYGSYDAQAGYDLRKVFVIDRDGRVAYVESDYAEGDADALHRAIEAAAARH
jgi:peroxiredoxin